jgi:hypothetical protein
LNRSKLTGALRRLLGGTRWQLGTFTLALAPARSLKTNGLTGHEIVDRCLEEANLRVDAGTDRGSDDAESLDDQPSTGIQARELIAHAQACKFLLVAANEKEASKIATVRFEEDRLEAFDLAFLLETSVVLARLAEYLQRLPLSASHRVPPPNKQRRIRHHTPLSSPCLHRPAIVTAAKPTSP